MLRTRSVRRIALLASVALFAVACHGGTRATPRTSSSAPTDTVVPTTTTTTVPLQPAIVLTAQANELDAYATTPPFVTQTVVPSPAADRNGVAVSGQICTDPTDRHRFVAVDRTAAADGQIGWGVFELSGSALGKLSAKETARLVPTFQHARDNPTPFGCGFLPDGRLVTTDVGNQSTGPPNGQLVEWFPPFDTDTVASCKVDVALAGPQGVLAENGAILVALSRGGGVASFPIAALPTSGHSNGGCTRRDATRAPLASGVAHSPLIANAAAHGLESPAAIAPAGNGDLYLSFPRTGTIAEITIDGRYVRRVLAPPGFQALGKRPFSTGTPMGLGVDPSGTLYYADPGLVVKNGKVVDGLRTGTVRRILFVGGVPQPPEVVDSGLQSPYGLEIWVPTS